MAERPTTTTIPKIDPPLAKHPSNYIFWKARAVPLFNHLKVWDIISLRTPTPVIPELVEDRIVRGQRVNQHGQAAANAQEIDIVIRGNAEEVELATEEARGWSEKNILAKLVIMNSIDASCASMLSGMEEASSMWKRLADHFVPKTTSHVANTLSQIAPYKATEDLDITEWTTDMLNLKLRHQQQGGEMHDSTFAELLLANLPDSQTWTSFVQVASRTRYDDSDELITMINGKYERMNAKNPERLASVFTARAKATKRRANSVSAAPATVAAAGGSYRRSRSAGPSQPSICSNCHQMGHLPAECFDKGGGKEGQFPKTWDTARIARRQEMGEKRRGGGDRTRRTAQAEATIEEVSEDDSIPTVSCFVSVPSVFAAFAGTRTERWNHDSCSTDHVTWNRDIFCEYREITPLVVEGFDKTMTTEAIGRGKVVLCGEYKGKRTNLELNDVLHMPNARNNLVSGIKLAKMGITSHLGKEGLTLIHEATKRVICGGTLATFFELDAKVVNATAPSVHATKSLPQDFGTVGWAT